jgi:cytochrome c oxidase assembly protein subunit 15
MRRLGWAALAAVIVQGVLGGLTVILLLPKAVSIGHATLAQLFFSATVALALFTSPGWKRGPEIVVDETTPSLRSLALAASLAVLAQLVLGAAYRHRMLGLAPHVVGALAVLAVVLVVAMFALQQFPRHRDLRRAANWTIGITLGQVLLGILAYLSRIYTTDSLSPSPLMVLFTVLHVAAGALTMAASVVFAIQVLRNVRRPAEEAAGSVSTA